MGQERKRVLVRQIMKESYQTEMYVKAATALNVTVPEVIEENLNEIAERGVDFKCRANDE